MARVQNITRIKNKKYNQYLKNNLSLDILWFAYHKRFFGSLIKRGLKQKASSKMLKIMYMLKKQENGQPGSIFLGSFLRIAPEIEVKYFRRGRTKQPYVVPISTKKKIGLSVRWVLKAVSNKHKTRAVDNKKVVDILLKALRNKGEAIIKKKMNYKLAAANKHIKPPFYR